ncbi:transcription factor Thi5 [Schizosaccharomyces japonicus yFS275]|uniref:Transcription factor Thi5 n=1 Tax=Schizosaccharomyces japonicus (strain yFS275 / FY16936) TaxID=402676 RepID=B6K2D8_SCHJY|nr:transcription factor Thi5 [Schizosaccharomyces japonicus yFS275]EEB07319.1 transcription factor Thi5 [Schizosaccharomyces japonicus yFS275]
MPANDSFATRKLVLDVKTQQRKARRRVPADHRQRVRKACLNCRAKKIRCDGCLPCQVCISANLECKYPTEQRALPPSRQYLEELLERQRCLEYLMSILCPDVSLETADMLRLCHSINDAVKESSPTVAGVPENDKIPSKSPSTAPTSTLSSAAMAAATGLVRPAFLSPFLLSGERPAVAASNVESLPSGYSVEDRVLASVHSACAVYSNQQKLAAAKSLYEQSSQQQNSSRRNAQKDTGVATCSSTFALTFRRILHQFNRPSLDIPLSPETPSALSPFSAVHTVPPFLHHMAASALSLLPKAQDAYTLANAFFQRFQGPLYFYPTSLFFARYDILVSATIPVESLDLGFLVIALLILGLGQMALHDINNAYPSLINLPQLFQTASHLLSGLINDCYTVTTVQALLLYGLYHLQSARLEMCHGFLGFASHISDSIGLYQRFSPSNTDETAVREICSRLYWTMHCMYGFLYQHKGISPSLRTPIDVDEMLDTPSMSVTAASTPKDMITVSNATSSKRNHALPSFVPPFPTVLQRLEVAHLPTNVFHLRAFIQLMLLSTWACDRLYGILAPLADETADLVRMRQGLQRLPEVASEIRKRLHKWRLGLTHRQLSGCHDPDDCHFGPNVLLKTMFHFSIIHSSRLLLLAKFHLCLNCPAEVLPQRYPPEFEEGVEACVDSATELVSEFAEMEHVNRLQCNSFTTYECLFAATSVLFLHEYISRIECPTLQTALRLLNLVGRKCPDTVGKTALLLNMFREVQPVPQAAPVVPTWDKPIEKTEMGYKAWIQWVNELSSNGSFYLGQDLTCNTQSRGSPGSAAQPAAIIEPKEGLLATRESSESSSEPVLNSEILQPAAPMYNFQGTDFSLPFMSWAEVVHHQEQGGTKFP